MDSESFDILQDVFLKLHSIRTMYLARDQLPGSTVTPEAMDLYF